MFTITQVSHLGQVNFVPFGNGLVGDLRAPPIALSFTIVLFRNVHSVSQGLLDYADELLGHVTQATHRCPLGFLLR